MVGIDRWCFEAGGLLLNRGHLEICYNGVWGTVCGDGSVARNREEYIAEQHLHCGNKSESHPIQDDCTVIVECYNYSS